MFPHCCWIFLQVFDFNNRVRMRQEGFKLKFQRFVCKEKGLAMKLSKQVGLASPGTVSLLSTRPAFAGLQSLFSAAQVSWCRKTNCSLHPYWNNQVICPWKMAGDTSLEEGQGLRQEFAWYHRVNLWGRCGDMEPRQTIHHRSGRPCNGACPGFLYQSLKAFCHLYLGRWIIYDNICYNIWWYLRSAWYQLINGISCTAHCFRNLKLRTDLLAGGVLWTLAAGASTFERQFDLHIFHPSNVNVKGENSDKPWFFG